MTKVHVSKQIVNTKIPEEIKDRIIEAIEETINAHSAHGTILCEDKSGNISMGYADIGKHEFRCPSNTKAVASILMYPE